MSDQVNGKTAEEYRVWKREVLAKNLTIMTKKELAELHSEAQRKINGPLLDAGENDTVMPTDEFMPLHVDAASNAVVKQMAKEYAQCLNAFHLDFQRRWIPKMTDELILAVFSNEHAVPDVVFREMLNYVNK